MKKLYQKKKNIKFKKLLLSLIFGMFMATIACISNVYAATSNQIHNEVIQSYYDAVNIKNVDSILETLDGEYGKIAENIYRNQSNKDNYIGIFNISNAELLT